MLIEHMLLKIWNFLRALGAGEIEHEWSLDYSHLDREQQLIEVDECGNPMTRDIVNFLLPKDSIYFEFAIEAILTVKELDRGKPITAKDKTVLTVPGTKVTGQSAMVLPLIFVDARICHAFP